MEAPFSFLHGDPSGPSRSRSASNPLFSPTVGKALRRSCRRLRRPGRPGLGIRRSMTAPGFPLTFMIRNLMALSREPAWSGLTPRLQGLYWRRMCRERAKIFLATKKWLKEHHPGDYGRLRAQLGKKAEPPFGYCIHCGGCCEIASGYPDFPPDSPLPAAWRRIYGDGLGKGHRFCAFLWEITDSGQSVCAVHLWRSLTCRVFEREECDFFLDDWQTNGPFDHRDPLVAFRRFTRLIDGA
jgi:hypothetical protein